MKTAFNNYLIQLFTQICQIDSPTGFEKDMADFVFNFANQYANLVKKDKFGNVYVRYGKNPKLFLSAHLDTVEPGRGIKPKIKDGYIVSDGTTILGADNKVAVAAILQLLKEAKEENCQYSFETVFTLSEEVGNYGAINFDYSLLFSKIGFCFDSSNPLGAIIVASPFYERFDLKIIGKEAHASKPDEAKNVLLPLKEILHKQKLGKIDKYSLLNIGVIKGGFVRNTIPGELILKGEIRSFYEENLLNIKKNLIIIIDQIEKKYQIKIKRDFVRENPGYFHKDKKEITKIKKILKKLNLNPKLIQSWGVSDANIFNNRKNLLVFNLADGSEFSHSLKERIKISNLIKLKEIIKNLLKFW